MMNDYNPFCWLIQLISSRKLLHLPFFQLQSEHDGSDVQVQFDVDHQLELDIVPNMTRSPRVKYITYYEDSESLPGQRTAVWELDKGNNLLTIGIQTEFVSVFPLFLRNDLICSKS